MEKDDEKMPPPKIKIADINKYGFIDRLGTPLKKPVIFRFIEDLICLGSNSQKQKTFVKVVMGAGLLLSLVSGYTTFMGLDQYIHSAVIFVIYLVNLWLLLAASCRIRQILSKNILNSSIKMVFVSAVPSSVCFSCLSHLENNYYEKQRLEDELQRAQNVAIELRGLGDPDGFGIVRLVRDRNGGPWSPSKSTFPGNRRAVDPTNGWGTNWGDIGILFNGIPLLVNGIIQEENPCHDHDPLPECTLF